MQWPTGSLSGEKDGTLNLAFLDSFVQLLQQWQQVASNGTDKTALEFGDCTKSRHAKQWWEQPIPLVSHFPPNSLANPIPPNQVHFGSDLVLIALVGLPRFCIGVVAS